MEGKEEVKSRRVIFFQDSDSPNSREEVSIELRPEGGVRLSRFDAEGNEIKDSVLYGRKGVEGE